MFPNILLPAIELEKMLLSHNTGKLFPLAIYFVQPKPSWFEPTLVICSLIAVTSGCALALPKFQTASVPGCEERVKLRESPRY